MPTPEPSEPSIAESEIVQASLANDASLPTKQSDLEGRQVYNLVSDTVTGVNIRLRDNIIQGIAIGCCVLLGTIIGALLVSDPWIAGALVGAFAGLVIGFFASGFVLMVYRFVQHVRGKHD